MTSESSVAGHTPGPWMVDRKEPGELWIADDDHADPICMVTGAGFVTERDEADARLIAAAPELLEFAKWVADRGGDNNCMDIFKRARSVIAKAEGGAA